MTQYFRSFTILWEILYQRAQLSVADQLWERALDVVTGWEERTGNLVHKGAGLYFWGINQVLAGDLLRGFSLVHEALKEDQRTYAVALPDTPAMAFVSLNIDKPDFHPDMARWWAKDLAGWLRQHLEGAKSGLTLDDFRNCFVVSSPDISRVFLFLYALASMKRLQEHASRYRTSDFVGQLVLSQLFNVATVIERTIGDKNKGKERSPFAEQAKFLSSRTGGQLDQPRISALNSKFKDGFDVTMKAILDGSFVLPDGTHVFTDKTVLSRSDADIALAYGCRNRSGHQTHAPSIVWERFPEIRSRVIGVLFLALEHL